MAPLYVPTRSLMVLLNSPIARELAVEFCMTQALISISGRGKSNWARIRFRSTIWASSRGLESENTRGSEGFCGAVPATTPIAAIAGGLGAPAPLDDAAAGVAAVAAPAAAEPGAHPLLLPLAKPASDYLTYPPPIRQA